MKKKTQTSQRPVAAKSNKRGGRSQAASQNQSKQEHPANKIRHGLQKSVGICGLYYDALEFALEHLHEEGVPTASLFDAKTGEVTKAGDETITAAVEEGWVKSLSLAGDDPCSVVFELSGLLSDRAVFDYITANLVKRGYLQKPHAMLQVTVPTPP